MSWSQPAPALLTITNIPGEYSQENIFTGFFYFWRGGHSPGTEPGAASEHGPTATHDVVVTVNGTTTSEASAATPSASAASAEPSAASMHA